MPDVAQRGRVRGGALFEQGDGEGIHRHEKQREPPRAGIRQTGSQEHPVEPDQPRRTHRGIWAYRVHGHQFLGGSHPRHDLYFSIKPGYPLPVAQPAIFVKDTRADPGRTL